MNSKLEELAKCVKRPKSTSEEWAEPDTLIRRMKTVEEQDRKTTTFPYDDPTLPGVKDFYTGKDILITGGTGFVGKVLVEKLLRSTPEGGRIFLLARERRGITAQQRIRAMLELPLFKLLMTENPEAADRLVAIEGDVGSIGLGLSETDRQTLLNNVSVVFHCAATVRFDLATAHMVLVNVRGTREMVSLCKEMKKLTVFVHVSTAFANATKDRKSSDTIAEEFIRPKYDWRKILEVVENSDQNGFSSVVLDLIFDKLESTHQNNYTFTKALAESCVVDECKNIPTVIVRPTVVIASYEDPFGGWVDNLYGPMSIWDGVGQGVVRTHYGNPHQFMDYCPVDMCVKTLITAGWHRGIGYRFSNDPTVPDIVNNGTGDVSKHTYQMYLDRMQILFERDSHRYILRYPRVLITPYYSLFWLTTILSQVSFGIVMDFALKLAGRKPMLLSIYRRIFFAQTTLLHFFSTNEFTFDIYRQWTLQARMPEKDRNRFSAATLNYPMAYYHDNIAGIIKYVFKEKSYSGKESNRRIMYIVDIVQSALLVVLVLWIFCWALFWRNATSEETST